MQQRLHMQHYINASAHESTPSDGQRQDLPATPDIASGNASSLFLASTPYQRTQFNRRVANGQMTRLDRGLFQNAFAPAVSHYEIAACALRQPNALFCLGSALSFHGLTTSGSQEVWFHLPLNRHAPRWHWPRIHPVHLQEYDQGIMKTTIDGIPVNITDIERTVAECWRHQDVVGRDLCIEATRNAIERSANMKRMYEHARVFGVDADLAFCVEALNT